MSQQQLAIFETLQNTFKIDIDNKQRGSFTCNPGTVYAREHAQSRKGCAGNRTSPKLETPFSRTKSAAVDAVSSQAVDGEAHVAPPAPTYRLILLAAGPHSIGLDLSVVVP